MAPKNRLLHLAGRSVISPATMAGLATGVFDDVGVRLGVAGRGGDPPVSLGSLPDPDMLLDERRGARVKFVMTAREVFPDRMKPLAAKLDRLQALTTRCEAAWQLFRAARGVMAGTADFALAMASAHRLVRYRVLPAALDTLKQKDVSDEELVQLAELLAILEGLIQQESAALREALAQGTAMTEEQAQTLAALDAEEHLVDVMRRMSLKQPITQEELLRAGQTYARLVAAAESIDAFEADPGAAVDRRGSGR